MQGNAIMTHVHIKKTVLKSALLLSVGASTLAMSGAAYAQDNLQDNLDDEVVVTGTRQVIQDAINLKRQETSIVDGLSASEIGDIPALSIGDALQTLTSVAAQRDGAGVSEISIRGLGTFLGSTVINGREATNGSGNRSVNFSQFPSELFNKIAVQKTQEASLIEGGVAGQVQLSTLKPLEYGKRRIQFQVKGNIQPDNLNINNNARDVGHRLTGSYVDQFDFGDGQRLGISIGGQTRRTPIAEQEARSTSNFEGCTLSLIASFAGDLDNCDQVGQRAEDTDPVTGDRIGVTEDFVLTSSSRELRQQVTDDQRDSIFGAIQYQPNDRIDINLDAQYSKRDTFEERNIILINAREILAPGLGLPGFELTTAPDGSLRTATTFNGAEHQSETQDRFEDYIGLGGSIGFDVTDRLNLFVDASYSETERTNEIVETRLRTPNLTAGIGILQNGSEAQQFTLLDFDINDPNNFARGDSDGSDLRVREDLDAEVSYDISAIRADLTYDFDNSWLTQLKAGARFSSQNFTDVPLSLIHI